MTSPYLEEGPGVWALENGGRLGTNLNRRAGIHDQSLGSRKAGTGLGPERQVGLRPHACGSDHGFRRELQLHPSGASTSTLPAPDGGVETQIMERETLRFSLRLRQLQRQARPTEFGRGRLQ